MIYAEPSADHSFRSTQPLCLPINPFDRITGDGFAPSGRLRLRVPCADRPAPTPTKTFIRRKRWVVWDAIFEPEVVEQLALITLAPTHHRPAPLRCQATQKTESAFARHLKPFIDSIDPAEIAQPWRRSSWPMTLRLPAGCGMALTAPCCCGENYRGAFSCLQAQRGAGSMSNALNPELITYALELHEEGG